MFAATPARVLGALGIAAGLMTGPAAAAPADLAVLQGFAGRYAGEGTLRGKDGPSTFGCTLEVSRGNAGKIVFRGTCNPLSVAGAMAFDAGANRFELAMTSNADFSGMAFGRRDGDDLHFSLRDRDVNEDNRSLTLSAEMAMRGDVIILSFDAVLDGEPWTGTLRFTK